MLVFQILVVLAVILAFIFYGSRELCPSCGTSLNDDSMNPFGPRTTRNYCRCGWRARD
jgi:hypothetical protein